jgi:hypothetical protein
MAAASSSEKQASDGFQLRRLSAVLAFGLLLAAVGGISLPMAWCIG